MYLFITVTCTGHGWCNRLLDRSSGSTKGVLKDGSMKLDRK